jgi:hypothetical protein
MASAGTFRLHTSMPLVPSFAVKKRVLPIATRLEGELSDEPALIS